MGRINVSEIDDYQISNSGEFFQLKDDGDSKIVYILAETPDDIEAFVIHKVTIDGKQRNVCCLRKAGDPIDYCPLCAAGVKQDVRLFLQLYDTEDGKVKVWDRGKSIIKDVETFFRRNNPLYKAPAEIIRKGAKGDQKTSYTIYPVADKNYQEATKDILGYKVEVCAPDKAIILDKTYEELESYLKSGNFGAVSGSVQPTQPQVSRVATPQAPASQKQQFTRRTW
jgi:hypothetical protein